MKPLFASLSEHFTRLSVLLLGFVLGSLPTSSLVHSAEVTLVEHPAYAPCSIRVEGKIEPGDFGRFAQVVQKGWAQDCLIFEILLSSPGGNVHEAIKIGRLIRLLGAKTHAPMKITWPARGRDGCALFRIKRQGGCLCGSACVLIWSGGTERSGEEVYVHRPYFTEQFPDPLGPASQQAYRDGFVLVSEYMRNMNFPQSIIDKMLSTSSANMSQLTQSELAMVENDPVWEELAIRTCGPKYGWRAVRRDKTLLPKAIKQSECAKRFFTDHLARLKPEAMAYIQSVLGASR